MAKIWFITGASRGFGREWTIAALERGDKVAATARNLAALTDVVDRFGDAVLPLQLDITDREADRAAVERAHEHFGRLDVVVNNGGYTHMGYVEELTEEEVRRIVDTNLLGTFWVSQAALPYLREQGSGHIINISSIAGVYAAAGLSSYNMTKWGMEGFTQAMAAEVKPLGIHVTLIEPTLFDTEAGTVSLQRSEPKPEYDEVRAYIDANRSWGGYSIGQSGSTAPALFALADADEPPLRCFFGTPGLGIAKAQFEARIAEWEAWNHVSAMAQGGE